MILIGCGVVVTTTRGSGPSRNPNISMSHASGYRHEAISSHHAASCCGPRRRSGSSAVGCRNGPVRPGQPALCWLVLRPLLRWPDRQQAALAFDHDIAGIGCGRRDQRDPAAAVMDDLVANTLRTAAGLAKAATGQQQPGPP